MIDVGIVGGTGYTGIELMRLLFGHPQARVRVVTSRSEAGTRLDAMFPSLRGHTELAFSAPDTEALAQCDLVFFATPHGVAMQQARDLLEAGVRVIDLSADFRLADPVLYERWYRMPHAAPELIDEAVYGLPELERDSIRRARLVANPGCYPTAVLLGLAPLLALPQVEAGALVASCASGVSGSGRKAELALGYAETGDNFRAYGLPGHRHGAEIDQQLRVLAGRAAVGAAHTAGRAGPARSGDVHCLFVPHLLPIVRGIHATLFVPLNEPVGAQLLQQAFESAYAGEPFVDVMPPGSMPQTRSVRASNAVRIAVHLPQPDMAVVLVVLDNLTKGAAGQAVQSMNLMLGLDEACGLERPAVMP